MVIRNVNGIEQVIFNSRLRRLAVMTTLSTQQLRTPAARLWGPRYLDLLVIFINMAAGAGYLVGTLVVAGRRHVVSRS